jgi:ankyrin repeat protein
MAHTAVDSIISGDVTSANQLRPLAPAVLAWVQSNLLMADKDDEVNRKIKIILSTPRFVHNLPHFGLWNDFIEDCKSKALGLGQEMQRYFVEKDLGNVLGASVLPNAFGKFCIGEGGLREVIPCNANEGERRLDSTMPISFPQLKAHSQLWSEKCYIHAIRMVAMGIDASFQQLVRKVCARSKGMYTSCRIKGFVRMMNKCLSRDDHLLEEYPRPALNIDLNRNACTFEKPDDLLSFIGSMKQEDKIGSHPVRIKNMMLFDTDQARKQFFYRTVMINWLYTPGFTYNELAALAKPLWDQYRDFEQVPGYGQKDPSEPWGTWRQQVQVAMDFLTGPEIGGKQVQFIVETQLLLKVYLIGRQKMHLLYKIARADTAEALCNDFRTIAAPDARSFDQIQDDALNDMKEFLAKTDDVNYQHEELKGMTMLWKAAELGHEKAVQEILRYPRIDPNKVRSETQTTPLYIAAHRGHVDVVRALAAHPNIKINVGALRINASPLFVASQEGHEMVVEELMRANNIDINQPTSDGITPLCQACNMGHEHVVELLIRVASLNIEHETKDGATALTLAAIKRQTRIVNMIQNMKNNLSSSKTAALKYEIPP